MKKRLDDLCFDVENWWQVAFDLEHCIDHGDDTEELLQHIAETAYQDIKTLKEILETAKRELCK